MKVSALGEFGLIDRLAEMTNLPPRASAPEAIDSVKAAAACPVSVIGEITAAKDQKITLVDSQRKPVRMDKTGWEHFSASG